MIYLFAFLKYSYILLVMIDSDTYCLVDDCRFLGTDEYPYCIWGRGRVFNDCY